MPYRACATRRVAACLAAALSLCLLVAVPSARSQETGGHLGYYRYPALHGDTLVFSAEGDLWRVDVGGGLARRITTHPEEEYGPTISPDGRTVAFAASYEGPTEVYTMPIDGGLPTRRTWSEQLSQPIGWTATGEVLLTTDAFSTLPNWQLATVDLDGGSPRRIPLEQAADGAFAPDGSLFFTRLRFQGSHTRRYEGGTAENLWRFDAAGSEAVALTADYPGTSKSPMWWDGRVYFASDRDGTMNLWSMAPDGTDLRQHTRHADWEVKSPALQGGRVVYQLGPDLHLYDIVADIDRRIPIRLSSDLDQMRERWIEDPIDWVTGAQLSPEGDRVVLVARGEVFVMPVKRRQGRRVHVTRQPDVRYRLARFLPDGERLLALSDETGEVELWTLPADGLGERERLTDDGEVLRWDAVPSPDGRWIAHHDKNHRLFLFDTDAGTNEQIDSNGQGDFGGLVWSPDSRWLAYVAAADNTMSRVWIHDTATGARTAVTSDRFNSYAPAWSADGEHLFFLSDRNLQSFVFSPWGAYQPEPFIDRPTEIFVAMLRAGGRSPFAPDDELSARTDEEPGDGDGGDGAGDGDAEPVVTIDLEGLPERIARVPVPPSNYFGLEASADALFFGDRDLSPQRRADLKALAIGNEDPEMETVASGIGGFWLSPGGRHILIRQNSSLHVVPAAARAADLAAGRVDLSDWKFALDPREEWRQMFVEAWRLERDYFYDRDMHGVDWQAMIERYLPTVGRVTTRAELADLIAAMVAELSALHTFVRPGDVRDDELDIAPASLGARLTRDETAGGYRVEHVYRNDPDLPEELSPLARPGIDIAEGDVILRIDGVETLSAPDIGALLRNKAGEQVLLHVAGPGHAEVGEPLIVYPISARQEADLRYDEWEYTRRLRVEEQGQGRIGYLHLRAMGRSNYEEWARNFYPVFNREGLIIDVRHNRGGNIDSWILEKLMRRAWFYWAPRVGDPYWNMQYAFRGHMITLINERTASDGEAFAEGFRRLGLGPLLGTRTWGGEIWLTSSNLLVDRGIATAAEFGVYGPEGEWLIEGWGVEPDIEVDNPPHATFNGEDAQLDAAVRYLLRKIEEEPVPIPVIPPRPDRSHETNRGQQ